MILISTFNDKVKKIIIIIDLFSIIIFSFNSTLSYFAADSFLAENATVTGWGRYSIKTKKTSPILREYTGEVVNSTACAKSWEKFPSVVAYADKHLCLGVKYGTPCHVSVTDATLYVRDSVPCKCHRCNTICTGLRAM